MVEKVGYTRPVGTARSVRKAGNVGAAGFAEALAAAEGAQDVGGVEATSAVAAVGALGSLLGAQEVDEREARRRKALKQGRLTLDTLEKLRHALLMGTLPYSVILQLEQLVAHHRDEAVDPILKEILDEIEVRAAVELAKLEVAGWAKP